ncbi:MAG: phosphate-starvation-inducible PsiE family protein [Nitrospirota bacterium]
MEEEKKEDFIEIFRKGLIKIDLIFHVVAALLLLFACSVVLYYALLNILHPSRDSMIHLVNDVLLALIILELLWTVIRFLKKQKFLLAPFLAIGIIVAVRKILIIEAQTFQMEHMSVERLYELGLMGILIIILMVSYYLSVKAQKLEQ